MRSRLYPTLLFSSVPPAKRTTRYNTARQSPIRTPIFVPLRVPRRIPAPTDDTMMFALVHPGDELTAAGVRVVGHQTRSPPLQLIDGQSDRFRIEFRVVQERQLTEPRELAVTARESAAEPVGDVDTNQTLPSTCVEDDRME